MTAPTPSAAWPLPSLITSLKRAGWGLLHGRRYQGVRSTLLALEGLLPRKSAQGLVTAYQIAEAAGLSERWTRRCLRVLEDLDLITWDRGTIRAGRPTASYIRVSKRTLATFIRLARGEATRRLQAHRKAFIARFQKLRTETIPPYHRENASPRAELSASPTHLKVEAPPAVSASPPKASSTEVNTMPTIPTPHRSNWPTYCEHFDTYDEKIIVTCVDCRLTALTPEQFAEYDAELKHESINRSKEDNSADPDPLWDRLRAQYPEATTPQLSRLYVQELQRRDAA